MLELSIAYGLGIATCYWWTPITGWLIGTAWPWLMSKLKKGGPSP